MYAPDPADGLKRYSRLPIGRLVGTPMSHQPSVVRRLAEKLPSLIHGTRGTAMLRFLGMSLSQPSICFAISPSRPGAPADRECSLIPHEWPRVVVPPLE